MLDSVLATVAVHRERPTGLNFQHLRWILDYFLQTLARLVMAPVHRGGQGQELPHRRLDSDREILFDLDHEQLIHVMDQVY